MVKDIFSELVNAYNESGGDDFKDPSLTNSSLSAKVLLYTYLFYEYFGGDYDYITDLSEACMGGKNTNTYIKATIYNDEPDNNSIDVYTSLFINKGEIDLENIKKLYAIMQSEIENYKNIFDEGNMVRVNLERALDGDNKCSINLIVVTNYNFGDNRNLEEKFKKSIKDLYSENSMYETKIIFGNELMDKVSEVLNPKDCVDLDYVETDGNGALFFGDEKSMLVNIKASSLKNLYYKYRNKGLYSMNLRYYISDKKVDPGLTDSIANHPNDFWYLNNGVIIVCDDYKIKNNRISLSHFSIVNGGQTTRMIGETGFSKDFYLVAKIIKNIYQGETKDAIKSKFDFFSRVAEASNTQKPIKTSDLIANKSEQKTLASDLDKLHIFVKVKRGDFPKNPKVNYPEAWQKTSSTEIAQLIYSSVYQHPGIARNSSDSLFLDLRKYNKIFGVENDPNMLKDLLIIRTAFNEWKKDAKKSDKQIHGGLSEEVVKDIHLKKNFAAYGWLIFVALVSLFAKFKYGNYNLSNKLRNIASDDNKVRNIMCNMTFNHSFLTNDCNAYAMVEDVYNNYIKDNLKNIILRSNQGDYFSLANYTKTDKNYYFDFLKEFLLNFLTDIDSFDSICNSYLRFPTENEKRDDLKLLTDVDKQAEVEEEEQTNELDDELKQKLTDLRKELAYRYGVELYQVFSNNDRDKIVSFKPKTKADLINFNCFRTRPKTKTYYYGDEICSLINKVIGGK